MTTIRNLILDLSYLPTGHTVREHLETINRGKNRHINGTLTSTVETELSSSIDLVLSSSIQEYSLSSNIKTEITTGNMHDSYSNNG